MDERWSPQQPAWPASYQAWPSRPSGLLKASGVLLLVGSIMSAVGAALILMVAVFVGAVFGALASDAGAPGAFSGAIVAVYVVIGLAAGAGSVCGFIAWRKVPGDLDSAFVWGLVGAILQGVNIVTLLGAIFAKACPESEARAAGPPGWHQPPQAR